MLARGVLRVGEQSLNSSLARLVIFVAAAFRRRLLGKAAGSRAMTGRAFLAAQPGVGVLPYR